MPNPAKTPNNSHTGYALPPLFLPRAKRLLALCAVLFAAVYAVTALFYEQLEIHYYLLWNMVLAALPLLFAAGVYASLKRRCFLPAALCGVLWLFFFPNGPYMLTDLIHISTYNYSSETAAHTVAFGPWAGFFQLCCAVVAGCVTSYLSLYLLHRLVAQRRGAPAGWLFTGAVAVLGGIALYIGRFMRFNTWDLATRPLYLLREVAGAATLHNAVLVGMLTALTLLTYAVFYAGFHLPAALPPREGNH